MKALVTGAAGFIGSHVVDELLSLGITVVGLDNLSEGNMDNVPSDCLFTHGSIEDYELLQRLFEEEKFDYVYHLAAYAAEGLSHFIRRFNYSNNVLGSANLINLSVIHHIKCFVFMSSSAVYGHNQLPMTEDLTPLPEDPYGIGKYTVELDLRAAHSQFGLNHIIFRAHNVIGPRQRINDRYRNVVGVFMYQLLQNRPMTIFGTGEQSRAFSYISDVAPYVARSVLDSECYNETFNIGSDEVTTINQLSVEVARSLGVEPRVLYITERNEVDHVYTDHSKFKRYFQPGPQVPLVEGLDRMASWARTVEIVPPKSFSGIEISVNLPEVWR